MIAPRILVAAIVDERDHERCSASADPGNLTTWRRCCRTFTGYESGNKSRFGSRIWCTAYQNGLAPHSVPRLWPSSGGGEVTRVTTTTSFGGVCGTDHPSHGVFYDRRSRFPCRCRSGVEQPSDLGDFISVPITRSFPPYSITFLRFILSPWFILWFYVFSIMCFSLGL